MPINVVFKDIYLDRNGKDFYSVDGSRRVRNFEGIIKVDDFQEFEREMVKLKDPIDLAKFIFEELGFPVDISMN